MSLTLKFAEQLAKDFKVAVAAHMEPLRKENAELRRRLDELQQRQSATQKELAAVAKKVR